MRRIIWRTVSIVLVFICIAQCNPVFISEASDTTAWYDERVGQTLADISSSAYTNKYSKGQCTWYCYGRALEKKGVDLSFGGNADDWYSNAESAGYSVGYEIKSNSIACFGNRHVIFVEWVDGDDVYITECNMDLNGVYTDGECLVKKKTKLYLMGRLSGTYQGCIYLDDNTTPSYVDIGTNFTAPILNKEHWKIIENNNGVVQTANETGKSNQLWYFERQSDGSYKISSCYDGRCLDVANASSEAYTKVQACESNDSNAQRWYIYEQDGGYVLKAKCTECVLDLPNNDPTNGNQLNMYYRNNTGAQIWSIYRGDECKLSAPSLSVKSGSSITNTTFMWSDVYGETRYNVKIWKDTVWVGDPYYAKNDVSSGFSVNLPAGTYQAYVDAQNYYEWKDSNVVTFTVIPSYTIAHWAGGFTNGEGDNGSKEMKWLGTYSYETAAGSNYTLNSGKAVSTIPNGYMLKSYFGSSSISGTWETYDIGKSVTQSNSDMFYEYYYTPDTYSITYNLSGGTNSSANLSTYNVLYGVSLAEPTREGYTFAGWTDENGNIVTGINEGKNASFATNASYDEFCAELATRTTGDKVLTANWVANTYEYVIAHWASGFKNNEGDNDPMNMKCLGEYIYNADFGSTYIIDESKALSNIPNGYYLDVTFTTPGISGVYERYEMGTSIIHQYEEKDNMFYQYYQYDYHPMDYTITYNLNGGTNASSNPTTYNVLYGVTLSEPTREGYTFAGWTDENGNIVTGINEGKNASFATNASYDEFCAELATRTTGDKVLTANWVANTYTIRYDGNGIEIMVAEQTKTHGEDLIISETIPTRDGYTFLGWSTDSEAETADYQPGDTFSLDADTTLYAVWSATPSIIPGDADGDGKVSAADISYLIRILAGTSVEVGLGADANKDGVVNATDMALMNRIAAGVSIG